MARLATDSSRSRSADYAHQKVQFIMDDIGILGQKQRQLSIFCKRRDAQHLPVYREAASRIGGRERGREVLKASLGCRCNRGKIRLASFPPSLSCRLRSSNVNHWRSMSCKGGLPRWLHAEVLSKLQNFLLTPLFSCWFLGLSLVKSSTMIFLLLNIETFIGKNCKSLRVWQNQGVFSKLFAKLMPKNQQLNNGGYKNSAAWTTSLALWWQDRDTDAARPTGRKPEKPTVPPTPTPRADKIN